MKKYLSCFLVSVLLCCSLTGCQSAGKEAVRQQLTKFASQCGQMDPEGILACVDPEIAEAVDDVMNQTLALSDFFTEETTRRMVFDLLADALVNRETWQMDGEEFFSTVTFGRFDIRLNGIYAYADTTMTCQYGGQQMVEPVTVLLLRREGQWYVNWIYFGEEQMDVSLLPDVKDLLQP